MPDVFVKEELRALLRCGFPAHRPLGNLRVAVSLVERRRCSGPSRAKSKDGGRFRLIALIEAASVVERILRHLHLSTELPSPRPGRAPSLPGACSFGQNPDVAAFNAYA